MEKRALRILIPLVDHFDTMRMIGKLNEEMSRIVRDTAFRLEADELMRRAVDISLAILLQRERNVKMLSNMIGDWPF